MAEAPTVAGLTPENSPHAKGRIAALDVIRGIAVLLVLLRHAFPAVLGGAGLVGVVIFFGLSGYLISGVLIADHGARGRIDLGRFYRNRAWRLVPALVVLLVVYVVVALTTGLVPGGAKSAVVTAGLALFYLLDLPLYGNVSLGLGHLWTLAIEEQFYLVWPMVLIVGLRRSKVRRVMVAAIVVLVVVQLVVAVALLSEPSRLYILPTSWMACLALGALARVFREELLRSWCCRPLALVCCAALVVAACIPDLKHMSATYLGLGLLVCAASLAFVVRFSDALFVPRAVEPLRLLGLVSYAAYLWNYPLIVVIAGPDRAGLPTPAQGVVALLLTLVAATASWYAVERPSQAYRRRRAQRSALARRSGANADRV